MAARKEGRGRGRGRERPRGRGAKRTLPRGKLEVLVCAGERRIKADLFVQGEDKGRLVLDKERKGEGKDRQERCRTCDPQNPPILCIV